MTRSPAPEQQTTLFHITHPRAGSMWLWGVLRELAGERFFPRPLQQPEFATTKLESGLVYSALYVTYADFVRAHTPSGSRRFVVIRDLRDTLVSVYHSVRTSHADVDEIAAMREMLRVLPFDEGLIYMMDTWLHHPAEIQISWAEAGEPILRFEDLIERDVDMLLPLLREPLCVAENRLREVVAMHRFDRLSGGRPRGTEDLASHYRKGVAGDWRGRFSPAVKREFKERFASVLVDTGYELGGNW